MQTGDERISNLSLLQIFYENTAFIAHKATQTCLNEIFFSIEISKKKSKIRKMFEVILSKKESFSIESCFS